MEIITYNQCACANCGHVIDYLATRAGEIVECPKCGEKSRLPEPEKLTIIERLGPAIPDSKNCLVCGNKINFFAPVCAFCEAARKRKSRLTALLVGALVVIVVVGVIVARPFMKSGAAGASGNSTGGNPTAGSAAKPAVSAPYILMEQPRPRMPKSTNDLKVGRFILERKRGDDLAIAVGDIQNDSDNVHTGLRADLDLLDRNGVKIGTTSDYFTELGPRQTWHFLVSVEKTNAVSVRFNRITEQ